MPKSDPAQLLKFLPEDGPGVVGLSTSQVLERAQNAKLPYEYSKKVHRALCELGDLVICDSGPRRRTDYWRKRKGASGIAANPHQMRPDQALALQLLAQFAYNQIPTLVTEELEQLIDVAAIVLDRLPASAPRKQRNFRKWLSKVAVEPGIFSLRHRLIRPEVFGAVTEALLLEYELEIRYLYRTNDPSVTGRESTRVVRPLGLVEVGGIGYLVASTKARATPGMYRLDRMLTARVLDEEFSYPATFSLQTYVKDQRNFDFFPEGTVQLELRFHGAAGDHLMETPMSDDQIVTRRGDLLEVSGTVMASKRLRWWIRSFGANVEVLGPPELRKEFAEQATTLAALYAGGAKRSVPPGGKAVRPRTRRTA
ncbi:WYL domain-containing protein [Paraburkholderia madseniana]|jgi:predicted DNA-binding transcriptional regulator YafY|uniref:WYL domain-containing protein n=1 Tax=Paraburkholderia madseniana TaxID=2599607 RepID=UPI0038B979BE